MPIARPGLELAARRARLAAAGLDDLILMCTSLPALLGGLPALSAALADYASTGAIPDPLSLAWSMLSGPGLAISVVATIGWGIVTTVFVARNGQSIGKRLLGIKVVRSDGARASLARIFWLRNVVGSMPTALPYVGMAYMLVDPLCIYQSSRQCLHDRIADTIVVNA